MSKIVSLAAAAAVAVVVGYSAGVTPSQAATVSTVIPNPPSGNDCAGLFGDSFNECNVTFTDEAGNDTLLSPVIAKWDGDKDGIDGKNTALYPSIDGSEFDVTSNGSTTWTYTPGADDPAIKYWVVKQGNEAFTLFWDVIGDPDACNTAYSLACLQLAVAVTAGTFSGDFSHITWYDTEPPVVPLPAGLLLFLTGLAGVGALGRFKAKRQAPAIV